MGITKNIACIIFLISSFYLSSQQANDCIDAIVVCGNTNISSNVSGFGTQELDRETNPCTFEEVNSLWFSAEIAVSGSLAFTIRPDDSDLEVDYDFYVFGPNNGCGNFNSPIRCNTTNPIQAELTSNLTGLRDSEMEQTGGPGSDGNGFVSSIQVIAGEQYYILVDRPIGNGGFSLEWTGTAGFLPSPELSEPNDIDVCSNDSDTILDLTSQEIQITNSTIVEFSYHTSYEDAFDQNNEITDPTEYVFSGNAIKIYTRVTNPNGCFEIVDFDINPVEFPNPLNLTYVLCDSDRNGTEEFNLNTIITDVENSYTNETGFIVTLHPNEAEAIANTNNFIDATLTSATDQIYARITSTALDADCAITYAISLEVIPDIYPASVAIVQCDVDELDSLDGITKINLEQTFEEVTGISGVQILYFNSEENRSTNNPIINPQNYSNSTAFNETLYYTIISDTCESYGEITLQINATTISLNTANSIYTCDDDPTDGVLESTFNLEDIRQNGYAGLEMSFYENLDDVALEQNPLLGNLRTTSTTIYARLENNRECESVDEIALIVNPVPEIYLESTYKLCNDNTSLIIDAPLGFDEYKLIKISDDQGEFFISGPQLSINDEGNYRLEVEKQYEHHGTISTCTGGFDFTVEFSSAAVFQEIQIEEAISGNMIEIEVIGDGVYEYSIGGEEYQDSPRFDAIEAGFYTVFARDKNGCGISEQDIAVVGFPKFFTPNNDGINDTWQIIGTSSDFEHQAVTIFDRYGKLVKQITTDGYGWDGLINGRELPSDDYWFSFTFRNGKEFKGHFTLKR